jgi:hypothetical protein
MAEIDFDRLADSWIAEWNARIQSDVSSDASDALDEISNFDLDGDHENLWKFILATYLKEMPGRVEAVFAAGPLEDLLAHFGPQYIDRVETLARQNPKFNDLLGGVWRNTMTDDVWDRVTRIRNSVW